ncbi:hypothetical protein K438DRAFT_1982184 [Mycena galopus ATCC 62051]|nr:hypothetical protein K438DRAFT_1982184 [Mycena galopus ATCC 62051]
MYFSHSSPSRSALDQTTEIIHVGSIQFYPPFEAEEGGVGPIVSFEEFCTDSDKIVDSEIQIGAETDDPQVEAMTLRLTSSNSQKIVIEPVPRYNADVSAEDRGDAPPPVGPVDPFDPLIPFTDATRPGQSAERLRYAETCWVGREVEKKKKEKLVGDAKEVEAGTKKTKGAYAAATAAIAAAAATQKAEPPSVDFGSIPNAPSSSTTPITTIAHSEKDDVLDNIDEIYMGNI